MFGVSPIRDGGMCEKKITPNHAGSQALRRIVNFDRRRVEKALLVSPSVEDCGRILRTFPQAYIRRG